MRRTPRELMRAIVRWANLPASGDRPTDADLLDRFVRGRDEAAFELLLWRHAGLVLAVCRRIVPDEHLAEDAFQATFLILARKAGSVRRGVCLAGWLHRVARRVAVRAAVRHAARSRQESPLAADPQGRPPTGGDTELAAALDHEVNRLEDRYRLPVVLCYLQGQSTEDAARLLGIPRGTVLSRLATARKKLADRLIRRGLAPDIALPLTAGAVLTVADDLVARTLRSALAFVSATGLVARTGPTTLAWEVLRMPGWTKVAILTVGLAAVAGVGTGVGVVSGQGSPRAAIVRPADGPGPEHKSPPAEKPDQDEQSQRQERARRLLLCEKAEEEITVRIEKLAQTYQNRVRQAGSEVDIKTLLANIERIDERILQTEESISATEVTIGELKSALDQVPTVKPNKQFRSLAEQDERVMKAKLSLTELERKRDELAAMTSKDNPSLDKAVAAVVMVGKQLQEARDAAHRNVENQQREIWKQRTQDQLEELVKRFAGYKSTLRRLHDKRVVAVERVHRAKAGEREDQLMTDELQVLRGLRQQLIRQVYLLRLEANGVKLGDNVPAVGDRHIDVLERSLDDLRREMKRLTDGKPGNGTNR